MVEFIGKGKAVLPLVEAEAEEVRKRGHDLADILVGRAIAHPADHVQRVVEKMGIDLRLQGGIYRFLFLGPRLAELLGQAAYAAGHVVKFPAQHAYFIVRGVSDPRLKLARAKAAHRAREARHRHRDAAGQQPRDAQHHQRNEHRRRYDDREHPCQPRKNLPVRNGQRQPVGAGGNLPGDDQIAVVLVVHGPALQLLGQRLPAERLRQKGEVFLRVAYAGEHGALLVADHDLRPRVGRQQAFQLGAVKADDDVAQELHIRMVQDAAGGQHHGPVPLAQRRFGVEIAPPVPPDPERKLFVGALDARKERFVHDRIGQLADGRAGIGHDFHAHKAAQAGRLADQAAHQRVLQAFGLHRVRLAVAADEPDHRHIGGDGVELGRAAAQKRGKLAAQVLRHAKR